jgi:hypothetical protein
VQQKHELQHPSACKHSQNPCCANVKRVRLQLPELCAYEASYKDKGAMNDAHVPAKPANEQKLCAKFSGSQFCTRYACMRAIVCVLHRTQTAPSRLVNKLHSSMRSSSSRQHQDRRCSVRVFAVNRIVFAYVSAQTNCKKVLPLHCEIDIYTIVLSQQ